MNNSIFLDIVLRLIISHSVNQTLNFVDDFLTVNDYSHVCPVSNNMIDESVLLNVFLVIS